jgi:hypothetical protein
VTDVYVLLKIEKRNALSQTITKGNVYSIVNSNNSSDFHNCVNGIVNNISAQYTLKIACSYLSSCALLAQHILDLIYGWV